MAVQELTNVHFLQVQSCSHVVPGELDPSPGRNWKSSSRSCSSVAKVAVGPGRTKARGSLLLTPSESSESSFLGGVYLTLSLVTVMRLGSVRDGGERTELQISQLSDHSGLYAYEHLVQVHMRSNEEFEVSEEAFEEEDES
jgi:hypothetical protein